MANFKGYVYAAMSAAAYGTNPAFAVPLYDDGMNPVSVLLGRYGFCLPLLALMIVMRGRSLRLNRAAIVPVALLGLLMAVSSLTLFEAYNYMNSGVASTLLFTYPVMVALIMAAFFHERLKVSTVMCLAIMGGGLVLLIRPGGGSMLSWWGCVLVFVSSLTYAIYLVMTNINSHVRSVSTLTLLFWQFFFGTLLFVVVIACRGSLTLPVHSWCWINLAALALIPSVISLGLTTKAIHLIGSTPTAIFGALEPLTAVMLSVMILGQQMTGREIVGGLLILLATTIVVASDSLDRALLRMRRMFPSLRINNKHRSS